MHAHWQNLKHDHPERGLLLYGRAWLHVGHTTWSCGWRVGLNSGVRAAIVIGGCENDFRASLALWLFAFQFGVEGLVAYTALPRGWGRTTGASLHGDHLVLRWNCDDSTTHHEGGRIRPEHGWYRFWFLKDVLLGRAVYSSRVLAVAPCVVPTPEGEYAGTATLTEDTWTRPRWRPLTVRRVRLDVPLGIPCPGKGENAWDCGEDAAYSLTCLADSVDAAVARMVEYVTRDRLRHGGAGWTPEKAMRA